MNVGKDLSKHVRKEFKFDFSDMLLIKIRDKKMSLFSKHCCKDKFSTTDCVAKTGDYPTFNIQQPKSEDVSNSLL